MKTVKEDKKNWFLCMLETIGKFFERLFNSSNKKLVIKSKCKDSCCCRNCDCIAAYDEKSDDDSDIDISVNDDNIIIK